jgi:hypothetical protein
MPEFFVPGRRPAEARRWWNEARARAEQQGFNCGAREIFRLSYERDGREIAVQVGERVDMAANDRLTVGAIFDAVGWYVICGIWGKMRSILASDVRSVEEFEA